MYTDLHIDSLSILEPVVHGTLVVLHFFQYGVYLQLCDLTLVLL